MPTWLESNAWTLWLGLALVLAVVEAATVDLVFLMLAGGALAAAVAAYLGLGTVGQLLLAAGVAGALLIVVRPLAKSRLLAGESHTPMGTERYVDRLAVVTEDVTETSGLASVDSDVWSARVPAGEPSLAVGSSARVLAVRGATLVLAPEPPVRDLVNRRDPS